MTDETRKKVAVVTGAAQGIGAAIAGRLVSDGYRVALVDLNEEGVNAQAEKLNQSGQVAQGFSVDVTDERAVTELHEAVVSTLGNPAVLVNNAGITRDNLLFRMTLDDWDAVMSVHLRGAFLMSRAFHSGMRDAGAGRIINLSSTSADGNRGQGNYSAAKSGVVGFTKTLAKELGRFGITANAVAPGYIDTQMLRATADRLGITFDEFRERSVEGIPMRRLGTPDDIANVVSFLAGEQASYITGETLHVSGGFHE